MKTKTYNNDELKSLLQDVEKEIVSMVKSEQDKLAKAHPGEDTSDETPPDASATSPAADSAPPAESAAPASAPADSAPPSDGPPAPDADAAPPADGSAPDAAGDPAADQSADPAALEAEYSKLPPEDLKAHYLACKSALFAIMGASAGPDAGAPPMTPDAAPPAPPVAPPAASPSAPPALKSEKSMEKSEKDIQIESLTADLKKSKEGLDGLLKVVEAVITKPVRKAVTSMSSITKSESDLDVSSLSKAEINTRLKSAVQTNLKEKDKDLIIAYDAGTVGVDQIKHLLQNK